MDVLKQADLEVWQAIQDERRRQQQGLELIASENYTSPAVLAAQGSVLTNKYAEGYPGRRYYGGCEHVDTIERLAIDRALKLFRAERANVQPHSGAQANMAVYFACLEPGDTILAMDLAHGGHLTHGMRLNFSGKLYHVISYGVRRDSERIDFDQVARLAREHRPRLVVAGASAYPREIDFASFAQICRENKALFMVDMAHVAGLVAAEQHQSPIPFAEALKPEFKTYASQIIANAKTLAYELERLGFRLVSGGTDNHLLLVDMVSRNLTGKIAEHALDAAGITVNKNM